MPELAPGLRYHPGFFDREAQVALVASIEDVLRAAPLYTPRMPRSNKPFSVRMSNCGPLGWVADRDGYRYQAFHPETGNAWPPMPQPLLACWSALSCSPVQPEACLINFYDVDARMGLHQDRDEQEFSAPVLSVSLGDRALFRYGGPNRSDPTHSIKLDSGDVILLGGPARLCFHGVDRIYGNSSTLLPQGGRINLTLRRVTPA